MMASLRDFGLDAMDELKTAELEAALNIVEWGRWSRGGLPTENPSDLGTPDITDEEALRLDRQIAQLPGKVKFVVMQIYIRRRGVNELANTLGVSNRRVSGLRDQGLHILYGALHA